MNKGQLQLGLMLTIGGAVGGSVMWIYNLITPVKEAVAQNKTDIAVLQEVVKQIPEIREDVKNINENVAKLMIYQGVKPIIATTSVLNINKND